MKRIIAMLLALMLVFALCACGGEKEAKKEYSPDYGELYFEAEGLKFGIMDPSQDITDKLGEPALGVFEEKSCAEGLGGTDYHYCYNGFELIINEVDGQNTIIGITVSDDTVSNPQGVKIGMSIFDAIDLMGDDYEDNGGTFTYENGSTKLLIQQGSDSTVTAINYILNQDA